MAKTPDELWQEFEAKWTVEALKKVPLFERYSRANFYMLAQSFRPRLFPAGEVIVEQGTLGYTFFLLARGKVRIVVNGNQVAVLEDGSFFGERCLVSTRQRNATVVAVGECLVLEMKARDFRSFQRKLEEGASGQADMVRREKITKDELLSAIRDMLWVLGCEDNPTETKNLLDSLCDEGMRHWPEEGVVDGFLIKGLLSHLHSVRKAERRAVTVRSPRPVNPEYVLPGGYRISMIDQDLAESVFAGRPAEADSSYYLDTVKVYERGFKMDWKMVVTWRTLGKDCSAAESAKIGAVVSHWWVSPQINWRVA